MKTRTWWPLTRPLKWQYGIRFDDGSVRHPFNGRMQRQRAIAEAARLAALYHPDNITPVRRRIDGHGEWETFDDDHQ
jgi:hypothetical protein